MHLNKQLKANENILYEVVGCYPSLRASKPKVVIRGGGGGEGGEREWVRYKGGSI